MMGSVVCERIVPIGIKKMKKANKYEENIEAKQQIRRLRKQKRSE
jgi:hypothetical protein|tara:strand:- start:459 stop:593 length:135 start_codon:yes stop_codon:yes gene_type:complete